MFNLSLFSQTNIKANLIALLDATRVIELQRHKITISMIIAFIRSLAFLFGEKVNNFLLLILSFRWILGIWK